MQDYNIYWITCSMCNKFFNRRLFFAIVRSLDHLSLWNCKGVTLDNQELFRSITFLIKTCYNVIVANINTFASVIQCLSLYWIYSYWSNFNNTRKLYNEFVKQVSYSKRFFLFLIHNSTLIIVKNNEMLLFI